MPDTWRAIASRKKAEQASRIPAAWTLPPSFPGPETTNVLDVPRKCGLLSAAELRITEEYDATGLVAELAAGRLKSVDIVRAFSKRAAIAHQLTNCLTEIFFESALERATALDAYYSQHGKPMGPLHGLPISLKDSFHIAGHDSCIGYCGYAFNPATTSAPLVQLLLAAGAVLYVKTNVPQTLMALDSHNNLFGRVLNPANLRLTAGGSSGGEGALLAMRGSPLGVGTDVGGSIRIPAWANGLFGIKPSAGRVPYAGQANPGPPGGSKVGIMASAGPIAHSARDCALFLEAVAEGKPWELDPDIVFGAWEAQGVDLGREVRVGVVRSDGVVRPVPAVLRLLDSVAGRLRGAGVRVVDVDISALLKRAHSIANGLFSADGYGFIFDVLGQTGEPLSPWLQGRLRQKDPKTLAQVAELQARRDELRTELLRVWADVDVLLTPVAPHPVPPIDGFGAVGLVKGNIGGAQAD
ncbi:amidase signature enzyme [Trichodelitschia bisporula]|uniref:amidase n=1 Tax=Trichodelitschia bisporula TaxID=703511 RepID=A0A6G1HJF0_9PEZI|nr:amidase signature enzyme [Trichodelitschia bisporula]